MPTSQDCSVSAVAEVTYKTYVAPTRSFEFTNETLDWQKDAKQGQGMRVASRVDRRGRRVVTKGEGKGDLELDFVNKGMGLLLNAGMGANTVTQISASAAWQHVYTFGDTPPSLTVQKGLPMVDGTLNYMSYLGCMVESFDIESPNGEIVTAKFGFDVGDYTNAQAGAALAYPTTPELFHFGQGEVKLGGTVTLASTTALASSTGATTTGVRDFSFSVNANLNTERFNYNGVASGQGRKAKPVRMANPEITGKFTAEYDANTYRDAYLNDSDVPLLVTFTGSTIAGANKYALQLVLPSSALESGSPQSNGGDLITIEHNFKILDGLVAAQPVQVVYVTTDTAV